MIVIELHGFGQAMFLSSFAVSVRARAHQLRFKIQELFQDQDYYNDLRIVIVADQSFAFDSKKEIENKPFLRVISASERADEVVLSLRTINDIDVQFIKAVI